MTAADALSHRLAALADAGTLPPCAGRREWTSDAHDDHDRARIECRPCPVLALCAESAAELKVTAGTWAGITYGTTARKARTA